MTVDEVKIYTDKIRNSPGSVSKEDFITTFGQLLTEQEIPYDDEYMDFLWDLVREPFYKE